MAEPSKTRELGSKTHGYYAHQQLAILNRDPRFDYSFQRRKDVEEGGLGEQLGWEPVTAKNSCGETWAGPSGAISKTAAKKSLYFQDTLLCKRPLEVSAEIKRMEDEKYNAQKFLVKNAARNARIQLRQIEESIGLEPSASVEDRSTMNFTQRKGPTQET